MSSSLGGPSRLGSAKSSSSIARTTIAKGVQRSNVRPAEKERPTEKGPSGPRDPNNIRVVVRCRGRSEMEINEKTPVIAKTDGPISSSVTIETGGPSSSTIPSAYPIASLPFTERANVSKTYSFDRVFGPEADQTLVYKEVVEDMLEQVLAGYNCAIFAYGQTGTGKTYTMQGDTGLTPLKSPVADAGVIPRVLHRLFVRLQVEPDAEYAVKCAYVELYNEQLRDLLAPDYKQSGEGGLRIYDEVGKKGITIQGLEEVNIGSTSDGLALLQKGSQRRQVAETKMNSESSRSHTIFTLTVHTKEQTGRGTEEIVKIGKFHLVDLAGSEAIGRSGAENKRAREAGMINQSLLTLGRVISALVDRSSHIPYRESKLTRLLQDALGGKTKTCIIATISPTRSNMEETLSTLEYALRAKSICNKPELNQKTTKGALIKDYLSEIDRLKSDLLACHEKSGVWFSTDTWKELSTEHDNRRVELDDTKQRSKTIELRHNSLQEEYQQNMAMLVERDERLEGLTKANSTLSASNTRLDQDLQQRLQLLDQERYLSKKYEAGEKAMQATAINVKKLLQASVVDLNNLFAKGDRLTSTLKSNTQLANGTSAIIAKLLDQNISIIDQIQVTSSTFVDRIRDTSLSQLGENIGTLDTKRSDLERNLSKLESNLKSLTNELISSNAEVSNSLKEMGRLQEQIVLEIGSWVQEEEISIDGGRVALSEAHKSVFQEVVKVQDYFRKSMQSIMQTAHAEVEAQRSLSKRAVNLGGDLAKAELDRIQKLNSQLEANLLVEQAKNSTLQQDLAQSIVALIADFGKSQQAGMASLVGGAIRSNEPAIEVLRVTDQRTEELHVAITHQEKTSGERLEGVKQRLETEIGKSSITLVESQGDLNHTLSKVSEDSLARLATLSQTVETKLSTLQAVETEVSSQLKKSSSISKTAINSMHGDLSTCVASVGDDLSSLEQTMQQQQQEFIKTMEHYEPAFVENISAAKDMVQKTHIANMDLARHMKTIDATGHTPIKKHWDVPSTSLTVGNREDLMARFNDRLQQAKVDTGVEQEQRAASEEAVAPAPLKKPASPFASIDPNAKDPLVETAVDSKPNVLKRSMSKAMQDAGSKLTEPPAEEGAPTKKRLVRPRTTTRI